jgi:hybrid cluster-associated redox disulfide protein
MSWSGDTPVHEIVDGHPRAKDVLESFGLPCWKCVVAYHETLAEGLQPHGIELSEVLARLDAEAPRDVSSD